MIELNKVNARLSLDKWKRIGASEGCNSEVWIARDTQLEQVLILKKITKESLDKQNVDDYFTEARILNESAHPNIMPIYYSAEDDDNIYITMPYYDSGSINGMIDSEMMSVREIIKYALDFLSGLLFIHTKETLHLDIKPTNIIINESDRAILTDFGLSRYLNEHGLVNQEFQYRKHRSPESYESNDKTILDDIYQAGLTIYRMCNGNENFNEQYEILKANYNHDSSKIISAIKKGAFPNRKNYLPHIPKKLRRIINNMLNPDVSKRYSEVLSVINDLSSVEGMFDWKCNVLVSHVEVLWTYDNEKSLIKIKIEKNKGCFLTSGNKYVKSSGNTQNIIKVKKSHNTYEEALNFIESMLPNYS